MSNKELGPEMKSTGEAIYFIDDLRMDYLPENLCGCEPLFE